MSGESAAYSNAIRGGLSLKGGAVRAPIARKDTSDVKKKSKKKKKKEKKKKKDRADKARELMVIGKRGRGEESDDDDDDRREAEEEAERDDGLTPSQRGFDDMQRKRKKQLTEAFADKTHREKINEFNLYLNSLSEHHDVPKVANAGLG